MSIRRNAYTLLYIKSHEKKAGDNPEETFLRGKRRFPTGKTPFSYGENKTFRQGKQKHTIGQRSGKTLISDKTLVVDGKMPYLCTRDSDISLEC